MRKMFTMLSLLIPMVFVLSGCGGGGGGSGGGGSVATHSVSGRITVNGSGIKGVFVDALDASINDVTHVYTDANGYYSLNLPDGAYTIGTSMSGYEYSSLHVVVGGANISNSDLPIKATTPGSGTPTITGISPSTGTVGAVVTITGTNFSTTPANNTVTFNGTVATVTAATATSITATVPNGVTTGTVSVTAAGGTTTSAGSFTVSTSTVATPTITGISPSTGTVGTVVTITGTNFSTTPANNTVKFNGTMATVTVASTTSITVTVPSGTTNGTVSVTTAVGTGTSGSTFTVTPSNGTDMSSFIGSYATYGGADNSILDLVSITGGPTTFQVIETGYGNGGSKQPTHQGVYSFNISDSGITLGGWSYFLVNNVTPGSGLYCSTSGSFQINTTLGRNLGDLFFRNGYLSFVYGPTTVGIGTYSSVSILSPTVTINAPCTPASNSK